MRKSPLGSLEQWEGHGTVTGNRVKWSAFHFRKSTLATEVEDQRVGRDDKHKDQCREAVTQIKQK